MLNEIEKLPEGLLEVPSEGLYDLLAGPTLIHLPGRSPEPLFVSVLLHGNERTRSIVRRSLINDRRVVEVISGLLRRGFYILGVQTTFLFCS